MKKKMTFAIVIAVIAIVAGFIVYNTIPLKSIEITKSIEIKASKGDIFDMVANQNDFHKWSPFLSKDPLLKYEIKEKEGIVGSELHWTGGKDNKDLGCQTVTAIDKPNHVGIRCDIQQPFASQSTFDYSFTTEGDITVVKQRFTMNSSFVSAFFLWAFGVKKEIETTNELGLQLLKKVSENK